MKKPFQTSKLGRLDDVGGKAGGNSSHVHGLGPLPFKCPSAEVKGLAEGQRLELHPGAGLGALRKQEF